VRGVINPLRATGGAERDGPEAIRRNIPVPTLALSPLSRLVSVADHEYFARAFAGIGDVRAAMLSDGRYRCVHVTVAGINDAPLDADDGVIAALIDAYARFGDPALPVVVAVRERISLLVQAGVALLPGVDRVPAGAAIRARLADTFSFARRGLARPAYRSEIIATIQGTPGVDYVDLDVFGGIPDAVLQDESALRHAVNGLRDDDPLAFVAARPARRASPDDPADGARLLPAQAAYLRTDVPDTLIVNWL
jgi:predicted phage baseplate assembly protein